MSASMRCTMIVATSVIDWSLACENLYGHNSTMHLFTHQASLRIPEICPTFMVRVIRTPHDASESMKRASKLTLGTRHAIITVALQITTWQIQVLGCQVEAVQHSSFHC